MVVIVVVLVLVLVLGALLGVVSRRRTRPGEGTLSGPVVNPVRADPGSGAPPA